jgi:polysaccharide biosynthesis transport protein
MTKGSPVPQIATEDVRPRLLGDALRRYWALLLICAVGLGIAASLFAGTRPTTYVASARVLLRPTIGNPLGPDNASSGQQVTIAMQTEATLVDSDAVAALSNAKLSQHWTPGGSTVNASVPANTQVLLITFSAKSAREAQLGAQSVADAYLAYRKAESAATVKARSDILTKQIAAVTAKLTTAEKAQASTSATTATNATRQVQLLTSQLVSLQDTLSQLQGTDTAPGAVLSPATLPGKASGLGPQIIIGVGAILGLLAGLVLAIALTRSDKRVRRSAVMVEDVPVLSVLGARRRMWARRSADHPQRGLRSAYQRLRIGALAAVPPASSIALSSLGEQDDVGDVAAELGSSFTRAGYHVIVVLATSEPTAMAVLDIADEPGLSDVLAGAARASDVLLERGGLQVLAPGRDIEDVQERLSGDRFKAALRELAETCDYVLVVGPVATTPSGVAVGRASTAMLLVGRELRTTSIDVEDATDRAELVGAHVIGLVLRGHERRSFSTRRRAGAASAPRGAARGAENAARPNEPARPTSPLPPAASPPAYVPGPDQMSLPTQGTPTGSAAGHRPAREAGARVSGLPSALGHDQAVLQLDTHDEVPAEPLDEDAELTPVDHDVELADLDEDAELADLDEDAELADLDEDVVVIAATGAPGSPPSSTPGE